MEEFWIWKKILWCSLLLKLASVIFVVIFINISHLLFISGIPYMQVWPRPKPDFRQWRLIATLQAINWFLFISEYWGICAGKVTSVRSLQHLNHFMVSNETVYRVSHELRSLLRESVPYVKLYRYNPKHLCPKLNGYGDNGHRKVWASGVSTYCMPSVTP